MIALSIASVSFRQPLFVVSNAFVGVDECVRAHLCDNVVRPYMEKRHWRPSASIVTLCARRSYGIFPETLTRMRTLQAENKEL